MTAEDYSRAIRESTYANSWGYSFDKINRNVEFWPHPNEIVNPPGLNLRLMCEIMYASPQGDSGIHADGCPCCAPGIIYCRPVPSVGFFKVFTLLRSQEICQAASHKSCSDNAQLPVTHNSPTECPIPNRSDRAVLNTMNKDAVPCPQRVVGIQDNRAAHRNKKLPAGKFPCKVLQCSFKHYNTWSTSNKHMKEAHRTELEQNLLALYQKPAPSDPFFFSFCLCFVFHFVSCS